MAGWAWGQTLLQLSCTLGVNNWVAFEWSFWKTIGFLGIVLHGKLSPKNKNFWGEVVFGFCEKWQTMLKKFYDENQFFRKLMRVKTPIKDGFFWNLRHFCAIEQNPKYKYWILIWSLERFILHDVKLKVAVECLIPCPLTTTLYLHPITPFLSVFHVKELSKYHEVSIGWYQKF